MPHPTTPARSRDDARRGEAGRRPPLGALLRGLIAAVLGVVVLASLGLSSRIAYVGYGPHDMAALATERVGRLVEQATRPEPSRTGASLASEQGGSTPSPATTGPGATTSPAEPPTYDDGEVVRLGLLGRAVAADAGRPREQRVADLTALIARLDAVGTAPPYAAVTVPQGGARLAGWRLQLLDARARLSHSQGDLDAVRADAGQVAAALAAAPAGILPTFPDLYEPVDTVVCAGALREAHEIAPVSRATGGPDIPGLLRDWVGRIEPLRDPATRLLPSRVSAAGGTVAGPVASSQALIQIFWPALDPATASRDWVAYENTFLCPRLGLVAVCEHPGGAGVGSEFSGPLVAGVSPTATALTLAASRAHGNDDLAQQISREAELFALPTGEPGHRAIVGDGSAMTEAALAWGRATAALPEPPGVDDRDPVSWAAWTLCALVPGVLAAAALVWLVLLRGRRFTGPLDADAAPPDAPDFRS